MRARWNHGYLVLEPEPVDEQAWRRTTGATDALRAIEARLVRAGAIIELRQFHGLSAQEVDVLLRLERERSRSTRGPQGSPALASGCPHAARDEVAA